MIAVRGTFLTLLFTSIYSFAIHAQEPSNENSTSNFLDLINTLKANNSITQAQYLTLKKQALARQQEAEFEVEEEESELAIRTEGGLELATYDGQYSFELKGRLVHDVTAFNDDLNELGDGTNLRQAVLGVEGKLDYDWGYELSIDFAGADTDIKDAYLSYQGWFGWEVKFGNAKVPFSLAKQTSRKYLTFLERPMLNELVPGRELGIHVSTYSEHWTMASSLSTQDWDDDPDDEGDQGWALTARSTYVPWYSDTQVLHLAAAMSYRQTDDEDKIKFNTRPETKHTDVKYLNTGKLKKVDNLTQFGLEAAWVEGPFSVQAEYVAAEVDGSRREQANFAGWYLMTSWLMTGESRNYKFKKGGFGRLKPHSEAGAWELAMRYSELDLNDGDIRGGSSQITTLGINWYINSHIRVMANYAFVHNDSNADDNGDVLAQDEPSYAQLRLQMDF